MVDYTRLHDKRLHMCFCFTVMLCSGLFEIRRYVIQRIYSGFKVIDLILIWCNGTSAHMGHFSA